MPVSFFLHNLQFALELSGAVALMMAAWLTFDAYTVRKSVGELLRAIGLALYAVFELIHALTLNNDVLSYVSTFILLIGLLFILGSLVKTQKFQVQAILVIPSYSLWDGSLSVLTAVLLFAIAFFSYRHMRLEMNKTWLPFCLAFALLSVATLAGTFNHAGPTGPLALLALVLEAVGFGSLIVWVWQFLQLRIRESLILIFLSAALLLATVVTLAFSTILISQVVSETEASLLTDAKVLDLTVHGLEEESKAKAALIATDPALLEAFTKNDSVSLEQIAETQLEQQGLGFLTITDASGNVILRAHALSRRGDSLLGERAFEEALSGNHFVTIESSPVEKFSIRAGAPLIVKGRTVGTVVAGFPLDNALVDRIKRITGLEMFVYEGDHSEAATALAPDGRTRLTGTVLTDPSVKEAVLTQGTAVTARVTISGVAYNASYLPLVNADGKTVGMISAGKPEADILAIENSTNRLTLLTVVILLLLLTFPIYLFTKRLAKE